MVPLLKKLFFCVVLNALIGAARLAISSVTEEAHAAQDSVIIPNVGLGGSSRAIVTSTPRNPSKQKQLAGQEYGIIPDGIPERTGEFPDLLILI
ncbi:hypothetical protein PGT21_024329 [Puccinia graminis f. sp. tritici]|uniref:Uncharacterized protein n=1 Tax=Puccinia graminis f. sp. tritici TaxID=56615 RepID=A0A5B0SIP7_PUCGR|nr:hypothetical protein PGT21_024329 [Puccinia graminis f. sp. tritici]KAA1137023.1 hypothetical protein PGTUg99_008035 [Puccinia graminis f. sp. tritici]